MQDVVLILTVIGEDRPGLVERIATTISAHSGNWLESSLAHLAGKFAGIVEISVPPDRSRALRAALSVLPGLRIAIEESVADLEIRHGKRLTLSVIGHDRIGIVRDISLVLARHKLNVEALSTFTASAPMCAELLFHAEADLEARGEFDESALKRDLERISDELMVDIALDTVSDRRTPPALTVEVGG